MPKPTKHFECISCGARHTGWAGKCNVCGEWGVIEEVVVAAAGGASSASGAGFVVEEQIEIQKLENVGDVAKIRYSTGFSELDRVLGGDFNSDKKGFVDSQVVLMSGEPGVGKSTLLLQVLFNMVLSGMGCLYVSAEESVSQVANRANRILETNNDFKGLKREQIELLNAFNLDAILQELQNRILSQNSSNTVSRNSSNKSSKVSASGTSPSQKPNYKFLIIDSIQTIYSSRSRGIPGSVGQIKACVGELVKFAKKHGIIMVIVGHITKEGSIAGPKLLEHMVDTVVQMEGDEKHGIRTLRSIKNRYGPTLELGLFTMSEKGMQDLSNPVDIFDSSNGAEQIGVCRSVVIEGVRPIVVEVQALTNYTSFSLPKRVAEGIPMNRLQRICAIISKYASIDLSERDIYVKITGNLKISDPALDMAVAGAIISSERNTPIKKGMCAVGELNLTGTVASVVREKDRAAEIKHLKGMKLLTSKDASSVKAFASNLF